MSVFGEILQLLGLAAQVAPGLASQNTPYAGVDRGAYLGAGALDYFHAATNLAWVGGYLDSPAPFTGEIRPPGHPPNAAVGHQRSGSQPWDWETTGLHEARAHGWGVLVIYWGQQDPANPQGPWDPRPIAASKNAADAIAKAKSANLDPHTVIYIDWEIGGPPIAAGAAYLALWFELIAEEGYRPGLYAHNPPITAMRRVWPDIAGWVTNPWITGVQSVSSPRVGAQVTFTPRDPGHSGAAADPDNIAWQAWFTSDTPWPAGLTFPAPAAPATLPIVMADADGSTAVNAAGKPLIGIDGNFSSVADPGFPERRMAPALIRRGRLSAAIVDPATLAMYAVRRGAMTAGAWTTASPSATSAMALPDHRLAFNPYSPHDAATRGTSGDLAVVARSSLAGTAEDAWHLHAYRRRGTTWTFDANIDGATPIEPLLGVNLVSREADTLEAFFSTNDGTHRIFAVSCVDAATQADSQPWAGPAEVPMPAGTLPSLVGGIGSASRAAGTVDVFVAARPASDQPYQLFWNSSSVLGTWPTFSIPGDPSVTVHPFSNIAAISRAPQQVDVFAIAKGTADANWILYTWWWNQADSWGAAPPGGTYHTQPIVGATVRPHPVSKLAAVSRSQQSIDVFVAGYADGLLYTVHWDQTTNAWSDFSRVGTNAVTVGSVDGAFSRDPNSLDIVITGRDGNVYVAWWNSTMAAFSDLAPVHSFDLK